MIFERRGGQGETSPYKQIFQIPAPGGFGKIVHHDIFALTFDYPIYTTGVCHLVCREQKAVSRIQAGQGKNDRTAHRQKQRGADFGRDGKREKS